MISNNFKIAWRNITSRKFYTLLNVSGLAVAVTCCIFIYLYTSYNLSFDTYHKDSKNIFRLVYNLKLDKVLYDKGSSYATYFGLKTEVPQVKRAAFSVDRQTLIISVNAQKRFKEENNISFTNADWFKLFNFNFIAGNATGLNSIDNAVLREKTAKKYFGNTDPIGRILTINSKPIKVVGVIADAPYNTDLKSDIYLSFNSLGELVPIYATDKSFLTYMGNLSSKNSTFVVLNNADQKDAVEKQIVGLAKRHNFGSALTYYSFKLLPLSDVHFDTRYEGLVQKSLLFNLIIIGLLIISIAIFNYINLTVAQQSRRAAEIATRKVLGGSAGQIFMQFITESLITSCIAVIIAFALVQMLLPAANLYLFGNEPVHVVSWLNLTGFTVIVMLAVTIGTGIYPAWILSRVSIAQALKSQTLNLSAGFGRRVMMLLQNTITQSLMVCTLVIVLQVHFLKNTDVGFDRKAVITIPVGKLSDSQREQLSNSLKGIPAVQSFSICYRPPSVDTRQSATVQYNNKVKWEAWPALFAIADSAYCQTFGLKITSGRDIRNNQPKPEFMINETMASMLEKDPHNVLGKTLSAGTIVGVVKDFSVKSLINPMQPTVLLENKELQTNLAVRLSGDHTASAIAAIQTQYQHILPDQVFSYQFVDEQLASLYNAESIQQKLILIAAFVAIFISSLGLLGLVSIIALQRTKEIGIRKVLGATVSQISLMLSNDFLKTVLLAFIIASPLSWWMMSKWLQGFAYRINISWWIFALAGGLAILVAIVTVSFQSIKAAIANPVKSLKNE